jgi:hypothetical protein
VVGLGSSWGAGDSGAVAFAIAISVSPEASMVNAQAGVWCERTCAVGLWLQARVVAVQSLGRAGVAERRDAARCSGGVATGSVAQCLLGIEIVCEDASGAFSRARVAASHTGVVRQSSSAAVEEVQGSER